MAEKNILPDITIGEHIFKRKVYENLLQVNREEIDTIDCLFANLIKQTLENLAKAKIANACLSNLALAYQSKRDKFLDLVSDGEKVIFDYEWKESEILIGSNYQKGTFPVPEFFDNLEPSLKNPTVWKKSDSKTTAKSLSVKQKFQTSDVAQGLFLDGVSYLEKLQSSSKNLYFILQGVMNNLYPNLAERFNEERKLYPLYLFCLMPYKYISLNLQEQGGILQEIKEILSISSNSNIEQEIASIQEMFAVSKEEYEELQKNLFEGIVSKEQLNFISELFYDSETYSLATL